MQRQLKFSHRFDTGESHNIKAKISMNELRGDVRPLQCG